MPIQFLKSSISDSFSQLISIIGTVVVC